MKHSWSGCKGLVHRPVQSAVDVDEVRGITASRSVALTMDGSTMECSIEAQFVRTAFG